MGPLTDSKDVSGGFCLYLITSKTVCICVHMSSVRQELIFRKRNVDFFLFSPTLLFSVCFQTPLPVQLSVPTY